MQSALLITTLGFAEPLIDNNKSQTVPFSLLYTAHNQGVSAARYPFQYFQQLQRTLKITEHQNTTIQHHTNLLAQDSWLISASDSKLGTALKFLQDREHQCGEAIQLEAAFGTTDWVVSSSGSLSGLLDINTGKNDNSIEQQLVTRRSCTSKNNHSIYLYNPLNEPGLPRWELGKFEFRRAISLKTTIDNSDFHLEFFGQPVRDFSRTVAKINSLMKADADALYVSGGGFFDGASSVRRSGLSLHRKLNLQQLQKLNPAALGLGHTELIAGIDYFKKEVAGTNLPFIATNWESDTVEHQFPAYKMIDHTTRNGSVNIAFVSIIDPHLLSDIPKLGEEGVRITDPIVATQKVVDQIVDTHNPDLIVALTTAGPETLRSIRLYTKGIDLLIGDPTMATLRVENRQVKLKPYEDDLKGAPLTLPTDDLSLLELTLADGNLQSLNHKTLSTLSTDPIDPQSSATITVTRAPYYAEFDVDLLYPSGTGFEQRFDRDSWNQMICEAVRDATDADTVLLRSLPLVTTLPGQLTEKNVADALSVMDVLESHRISGKGYKTLLDLSYGIVPISCGASPGQAAPMVWGKGIDPNRNYRIVTSDITRLSTPLKQILPSHYNRQWLDPVSTKVLSENGEHLTLRQVVLQSIRTQRDRIGIKKVTTYFSTELPAEHPPEWLLRVRNIGLRAERFTGTEDDTFAEVPETMATNPSSTTLGSQADIAVEYSSVKLNSVLRLQGVYAKLSTETDEQEVSDDWKLSSSSAAAGLYISTGPFRWMPAGEVLYDSELTPTVQEDGTENPHQSDLSLTLGFSSKPVWWLQSLKLGMLANRDLSQFETKPTEYALRFEWESRKAIRTAIWSSSGDLRYYASTPNDDASDLRYRMAIRSSLGLPITSTLAVSTYVEGLGIQGRVPETDHFGVAWNVGCSLNFLSVNKLPWSSR